MHSDTQAQRQACTKSTSLIQSAVTATDGALINVATLQLFIISVTSGLHSDMIGLINHALVNCGWPLHSKTKGAFVQ